MLLSSRLPRFESRLPDVVYVLSQQQSREQAWELLGLIFAAGVRCELVHTSCWLLSAYMLTECLLAWRLAWRLAFMAASARSEFPSASLDCRCSFCAHMAYVSPTRLSSPAMTGVL